MYEKILKFFFLPTGRINRKKWWLGFMLILGIYLVGVVTAIFMSKLVMNNEERLQSSAIRLIFVLLGLTIMPTIYSGFILGIKRFHDLGRSGWWILLSFAGIILSHFALKISDPLISLTLSSSALIINLTLLIFLGFFRGTIGPNKFGPDPLAPKITSAPSQE